MWCERRKNSKSFSPRRGLSPLPRPLVLSLLSLSRPLPPPPPLPLTCGAPAAPAVAVPRHVSPAQPGRDGHPAGVAADLALQHDARRLVLGLRGRGHDPRDHDEARDVRRGEVAQRARPERGRGVQHDLDVGRRRRRLRLAVGAEGPRRGRVADGLVLDVGRGGVLELRFVCDFFAEGGGEGGGGGSERDERRKKKISRSLALSKQNERWKT